ncbi:MAG: hypothetical protein LBU86_01970 [Oscillospiraceae bacterium]|nr:hypothetical protein [Oscillospiraceae bacterium]
MRTFLYIFLLFTTLLRLGAVIYLQLQPATNLPAPVYAVTAALVLCGVFLAVKRFISGLNLRNFRWFFTAQAAAFAFNIAWVAWTCPLRISPLEMIVTGTFLDVIASGAVIWTCARRMRRGVVTVEGLI